MGQDPAQAILQGTTDGDTGRAHPTGSFLLWGVPMVLIVLSTFEILDSVKKHPFFFLQIANGKSNFFKINSKCIEIEICSSGCSPEWTPSTKSVSQSWQSTGCPSSLQHIAADQRKQLKVRNQKKRKSKISSFPKIISVCERRKQIF